MVENEMVVTLSGLRKLEAELEFLKTVKRKEVAARVREAVALGGAWENPEYEASKNEQAFVEGRIRTLENVLRHARIIDGDKIATDRVRVGHRVRLKDLDTGEEVEYMIVGSAESDPSANRISNRSPVARAILGKKVGEVVTVEAPVGKLRFKILGIRISQVF